MLIDFRAFGDELTKIAALKDLKDRKKVVDAQAERLSEVLSGTGSSKRLGAGLRKGFNPAESVKVTRFPSVHAEAKAALRHVTKTVLRQGVRTLGRILAKLE